MSRVSSMIMVSHYVSVIDYNQPRKLSKEQQQQNIQEGIGAEQQEEKEDVLITMTVE